jgi:hypothetical protein
MRLLQNRRVDDRKVHTHICCPLREHIAFTCM